MLHGMVMQMLELHWKQFPDTMLVSKANLQLKQCVLVLTITGTSSISSREMLSSCPKLISDPERDGKDDNDKAGDAGAVENSSVSDSRSKIRKYLIAFSQDMIL